MRLVDAQQGETSPVMQHYRPTDCTETPTGGLESVSIPRTTVPYFLESCLRKTVHFPQIARCLRQKRPHREHPGRPYILLQILQLFKLTV